MNQKNYHNNGMGESNAKEDRPGRNYSNPALRNQENTFALDQARQTISKMTKFIMDNVPATLDKAVLDKMLKESEHGFNEDEIKSIEAARSNYKFKCVMGKK